MKKTFEFTEKERREMHDIVMQLEEIGTATIFDRIESIISERITPEPASSGQSAEDVLKGMYGNNTQYGYSFNSTIEAMRLHASQVCAGKDEIIKERELEILSLTYDKDKEIDRLNESLIVLLRKNAELEEQIEEHRQLGMERSERD